MGEKNNTSRVLGVPVYRDKLTLAVGLKTGGFVSKLLVFIPSKRLALLWTLLAVPCRICQTYNASVSQSPLNFILNEQSCGVLTVAIGTSAKIQKGDLGEHDYLRNKSKGNQTWSWHDLYMHRWKWAIVSGRDGRSSLDTKTSSALQPENYFQIRVTPTASCIICFFYRPLLLSDDWRTWTGSLGDNTAGLKWKKE